MELYCISFWQFVVCSYVNWPYMCELRGEAAHLSGPLMVLHTWIHCGDIRLKRLSSQCFCPHTRFSFAMSLLPSCCITDYMSPVSMAAASTHNHVLVFFENDVGVVIIVQHRNRMEFSRSAAGLWNILRISQVDQCLYNSMISSIHMGI